MIYQSCQVYDMPIVWPSKGRKFQKLKAKIILNINNIWWQILFFTHLSLNDDTCDFDHRPKDWHGNYMMPCEKLWYIYLLMCSPLVFLLNNQLAELSIPQLLKISGAFQMIMKSLLFANWNSTIIFICYFNNYFFYFKFHRNYWQMYQKFFNRRFQRNTKLLSPPSHEIIGRNRSASK